MTQMKKGKPPKHKRHILSAYWKSNTALAVTACIVAAIFAILAFDPLPSTIGDNAEFMILGKALAGGYGYRYINHPQLRPATKYPPGFPIMLAGWIKLFSEKIVAMKALIVITFALSILVSFFIANLFLERKMALVATLSIATSWVVVSYSYQILSDVPYTLFSLAGLLFLLRADDSLKALIGGGLSIWAYLVRTVGASLVITGIILLVLRKRKKEAIVVLACFVAITALWAWRNYILTGEGSRYVRLLLEAQPMNPSAGHVTFGSLARRVWINLRDYVSIFLPANLLPTLVVGSAKGGGPITRFVGLLIMAGVVVGMVSLRRKARCIVAYVLLYFGVYLVWPEIWRTERFMLPIAPLIAIFFFSGLKRILGYFAVKRRIVTAVCIVLVISNFISLVGFMKRETGYPPGWYNYLQIALWVRENTPEDSLVICRKPFLFYVFSYRKTIGYPYTRDHEAMRNFLSEIAPDYIVIDNFGSISQTTQVYLLPVLREMSGSLEVIYSTDDPVNVLLKFKARRG